MRQRTYGTRPPLVSTAARLGLATLLFAGICLPACARDASLTGRAGLAEPEATPAAFATCDTLDKTLDGFRPDPTRRVDLWAEGPLTIVQTDGVLWYLAICSEPGIQVMCVAYSNNGMDIGDRAVIRGAMELQDDTHVVLDPCLASLETGAGTD